MGSRSKTKKMKSYKIVKKESNPKSNLPAAGRKGKRTGYNK